MAGGGGAGGHKLRGVLGSKVVFIDQEVDQAKKRGYIHTVQKGEENDLWGFLLVYLPNYP